MGKGRSALQHPTLSDDSIANYRQKSPPTELEWLHTSRITVRRSFSGCFLFSFFFFFSMAFLSTRLTRLTQLIFPIFLSAIIRVNYSSSFQSRRVFKKEKKESFSKDKTKEKKKTDLKRTNFEIL